MSRDQARNEIREWHYTCPDDKFRLVCYVPKGGGMTEQTRESRVTLIARMREVYPRGRQKCSWCGERYSAHNFDCPVPDINEVVDDLERLRQALERIGDHNMYGWTKQTEMALDALRGKSELA